MNVNADIELAMLIGFGSAVAVLLGFGTYRTVRRNRKKLAADANVSVKQ
jgi:hypothetical protein